MDLSELAVGLGLPREFPEQWAAVSGEAPDATPFFLRDEYFLEAREFCGLDAGVDDALRRTAAQILADQRLTRLAWLAHHALFADFEAPLGPWPSLDHLLGEDAGVFYLLVALGMVGQAREAYVRRGVPADIARDSCREVACFCGNHQVSHGTPGLHARQLAWLRNYAAGRMYRLGRLEYRLEKLGAKLHVFRDRKSGDKLALAGEGQQFGADGRPVAEGGWTASFKAGADAIEGYPINPEGVVVQSLVSLDPRSWEPLLATGDWILDMHIPAGGGLTPEACHDSSRRAFEFFHQLHPELKLPAICCQCSWIFNTQFEEALPNSNLAKFDRELYLYPVLSKGDDGLWFVFCKDYADWSEAPRDSSLRRAMLDVVCSGGKLRSAGMLLFEEELPLFGSSPYRQAWRRLVKEGLSLPTRS